MNCCVNCGGHYAKSEQFEKDMKLTIHDTYWKAFILDKDTYSVYGLVSETDQSITFQWLGNHGDGKFYVMSTHNENKRWYKNRNFEFTLDYQEAYNHLMSRPTLKINSI